MASASKVLMLALILASSPVLAAAQDTGDDPRKQTAEQVESRETRHGHRDHAPERRASSSHGDHEGPIRKAIRDGRLEDLVWIIPAGALRLSGEAAEETLEKTGEVVDAVAGGPVRGGLVGGIIGHQLGHRTGGIIIGAVGGPIAEDLIETTGDLLETATDVTARVVEGVGRPVARLVAAPIRAVFGILSGKRKRD